MWSFSLEPPGVVLVRVVEGGENDPVGELPPAERVGGGVAVLLGGELHVDLPDSVALRRSGSRPGDFQGNQMLSW